MGYEPIEQLDVENYGCIRSATFRLTPLHALIGPNDSGKSTVLRALRTATQFAVGTFVRDINNKLRPFDPMLDRANGPTRVDLRFADGLAYAMERRDQDVLEHVPGAHMLRRGWNDPGLLMTYGGEEAPSLAARMTTATMVRFDPDALRTPTGLIKDTRGIAFADERGTGLASVLDAIFGRDFEAYTKLQDGVRALFPNVAKFRLPTSDETRKEIAITLLDGTDVGASTMSEGLLYYLGFAALQYMGSSRLFLVEEPENGLHPSRISEVMSVLREISKTSQVVIATHSPLVVNELHGNEVTVVTRTPEDGTRATLLKDVPGFEEAMKVYLPGEFWVSYADGKTEEPLLTGTPRA